MPKKTGNNSDIAPLCTACFGARRWHVHSKEVVSEIKQFPHDFRLLINIEIVTNKYFTNYTHIRSACNISLHRRFTCPSCDMSPLLCKSRNFRSTKVLSSPCHLCAATSCQVLDKTGHIIKVCVPVLH